MSAIGIPTTGGPIFVLGMLQRSGTNFLRDLLVAHPACQGSEVLAEDHLLHHAELLASYSNWVRGHWAHPLFPEETERLQGELLRSIGQGVLEFVAGSVGGPRPVLKTPSVRNLHLFHRLFGNAVVLVLVRDGRAMVESGMRSFGWEFEEATRLWAAAADRITAFEASMRGRTDPSKVVRYEDLVTDLEAELRTVFSVAGLDPEAYDFAAARRTPVRGSSTYQRDEGDVHWQPVERGADFQPLQRWESWSRARHERFNWLAGDQLRALGYEPRESTGAPARWRAWNRLRDGRWLARRVRRRLLPS
ncbi:MAG: sulfotransferase [Gemmatimonadota bacterium]